MAGRGWRVAMIQVVLVVRRDHRRPSGAPADAPRLVSNLWFRTLDRARAADAPVRGGGFDDPRVSAARCETRVRPAIRRTWIAVMGFPDRATRSHQDASSGPSSARPRREPSPEASHRSGRRSVLRTARWGARLSRRHSQGAAVPRGPGPGAARRGHRPVTIHRRPRPTCPDCRRPETIHPRPLPARPCCRRPVTIRRCPGLAHRNRANVRRSYWCRARPGSWRTRRCRLAAPRSSKTLRRIPGRLLLRGRAGALRRRSACAPSRIRWCSPTRSTPSRCCC